MCQTELRFLLTFFFFSFQKNVSLAFKLRTIFSKITFLCLNPFTLYFFSEMAFWNEQDEYNAQTQYGAPWLFFLLLLVAFLKHTTVRLSAVLCDNCVSASLPLHLRIWALETLLWSFPAMAVTHGSIPLFHHVSPALMTESLPWGMTGRK